MESSIEAKLDRLQKMQRFLIVGMCATLILSVVAVFLAIESPGKRESGSRSVFESIETRSLTVLNDEEGARVEIGISDKGEPSIKVKRV